MKPMTPSKKTNDRPAFALVVTLTLMVLLSILALGLLSLSSVELRRSGQSSAMEKAQSNAKLALMMALGELQREMGPDKRISAPGGQKLAADDTSGGANWTGVYESWDASEEDRPAPVFRRWLVSGEETLVEDPGAVASGASGGIALVEGNVTDAAVTVPMVEIPDGGYAWWIADQSTKAKIGARRANSTDVDLVIHDLQAAPRASHEVFFGDAVSPDDERLSKLPTVSTTGFLGTLPDGIIHHATAESQGLITDVRKGGFRRDLSFLLEKPLADADQSPLYEAGSTPGINMAELWLFHNIWGEMSYQSRPHADGGTVPSKMPTLYAPNISTPKDAANDPFFQYRFVTKLRGTFVFSLTSQKRTDSSGKEYYDLYLVMDPILSIWNPFNVAWGFPRSYFNTFKFWGLPYTLRLQLESGSGSETYTKKIQDIIKDKRYVNLEIGKDQDVTMRPGEVQILSQGADQGVKEGRVGGNSIDYVSAYLGWNFASGFRYKIDNYVPGGNSKMDGKHKISFAALASPSARCDVWSLTHLNHAVGRTDGSFNESAYYTGAFGVDLKNSREQLGAGQIFAKSFPDIFPNIELDPSATKTVKDIEGEKWPMFVYSLEVRTEQDYLFDGLGHPMRSTSKPFLHTNPKARVHDLAQLSPEQIRMNPIQVGIRRLNSLQDIFVDVDDNGLGYYGADYTALNGNTHFITHALPEKPPISMGAFQNAIANGNFLSGADYLRPSINHPIANSFAPSILAPSETVGKIEPWDVADHSFFVNRALWDTYFFSSVSPESLPAYKNSATAYSEQKSSFSDFLGIGSGVSKLLPNSRLRAVAADPKEALDVIFPSGNNPAPNADEKIGQFLTVDGVFNVNSTSVEAWKSVLSSLNETEVPVRSPLSDGETVLEDSQGVPSVPLLTAGAGPVLDADLNDPKNPGQWLGFRSMTADQIGELAKAIVKQVRLRGPFTSLSDFINRRPGTDKDLALSGPLQSALDDENVSINAPFREGERNASTDDTDDYAFPEAEAGAKSVGIPGYVKQGDLLTTLGPLIAVRGDTFLIRAYGESRNEAGKVVARALCEAVVQRTPDYVDPEDENYIAEPISEVNKNFGRRFKIVSFRFLDPVTKS